MSKLTITIPAKFESEINLAELKEEIRTLVANKIDSNRRRELATKLKELPPVSPSEIIVD